MTLGAGSIASFSSSVRYSYYLCLINSLLSLFCVTSFWFCAYICTFLDLWMSVPCRWLLVHSWHFRMHLCAHSAFTPIVHTRTYIPVHVLNNTLKQLISIFVGSFSISQHKRLSDYVMHCPMSVPVLRTYDLFSHFVGGNHTCITVLYSLLKHQSTCISPLQFRWSEGILQCVSHYQNGRSGKHLWLLDMCITTSRQDRRHRTLFSAILADSYFPKLFVYVFDYLYRKHSWNEMRSHL